MNKERIYRNEEIEKTCYTIANTLCGKKIRSLNLSMRFYEDLTGTDEHEINDHFTDVYFGRMFAIDVYDLKTRKVLFSCNAADICEVSFEKTGKNHYVVCVLEGEYDDRIATRMEIDL